MSSRIWLLSSSSVFLLGSVFSFLGSDPLNNKCQGVGYGLYVIAYFMYLYADYKNEQKYYITSTTLFVLGSLTFLTCSMYDMISRNDFTYTNIFTNLANLSWLVGYGLYFGAESYFLGTNREEHLNLLSVPVLHLNRV